MSDERTFASVLRGIKTDPACESAASVEDERAGETPYDADKAWLYVQQIGSREDTLAKQRDKQFKAMIPFTRTDGVRGPVRAKWLNLFEGDGLVAFALLTREDVGWVADGPHHAWGLDEGEIEHLLDTVKAQFGEPSVLYEEAVRKVEMRRAGLTREGGYGG